MTRLWWAFILISLLIIAGLIVSLNWSPSPSPSPEATISSSDEPKEKPSPLKYVGGEACATCHTEEHRLWTGSHHDLAMQEANPDTVLGNFNNTTFAHFGVTSRFYKQGNNFFVKTDGPDGRLADYEIAYTFGVTPLQQYLIEFPGGRYQALGIAWDSRPKEEGGQRWFHLYPDEKIAHDDELHWTGSNQNWNYMCAECHSTHLEKNYNIEKNSYETTWTDIDIGCEACHGPGSHHVAWAEGKRLKKPTSQTAGKGLQVQFPSFNDKGWEFTSERHTARRTTKVADAKESEACGRCHTRRTSITQTYAHGKPLLDTHLVSLIEPGRYHVDGQILDEVYVYGSFLQSKMYQAGITCNDCHEVHSLKLRETGNALCTRCHRSEHFDTPTHHFHNVGTGGDQCVNCHMSAKNYMVIDPRRDHSIRVPRPDLSKKLDSPNACNQCHEKKTTQWATDAVKKWYGERKQEEPHFGEVLKAGREGVVGSDPALIKLALDTTKAGIIRGTAFSLLRRYPSKNMMEALRTGVKDKDPLVKIGALRALEALEPKQRYDLGNHLLNDPIRAVRTEAGRYLAAVQIATLSPKQQEKLNQAVEEYIQSQLVNAERSSSHLNLGIVNAERGRFLKTEKAYQTALRLDADFYPALVNLADLYRIQKRDKEGKALLQQAIKIAPKDASVHHALGLLLVRTGQKDEAIKELKHAWKLQPENPRYGYVYGIALNSSGKTTEAINVLEEILEQHSNNPQILMALITILRDQNQQEMTMKYVKRLLEISPQNPTALQLLQQLKKTKLE